MSGVCPMPITDKRLAEIQSIADEDIDVSDIPEADASFFQRASLVSPRAATPGTAIPTGPVICVGANDS